jgi:N-acetylmuramic acid 6-phosphate etherase
MGDLYDDSIGSILVRMNMEDRRLLGKIERALPTVSKTVELVIQTIKRGGKVFLIGAGTSGRLAVIEAAEIRPTFGADFFIGIIAGGNRALAGPMEGAEDDAKSAVGILKSKHLCEDDMVIGIAASGTTPFTISAVNYARKIGASTAFVTCNKRGKMVDADVVIFVDSGREVVDGSTRLKAGTVTKMILNMVTTCAMIKLGYTYRNLMVGVTGSSIKLRKRQVSIIRQLTGCSVFDPGKYLSKAKYDVKVVLVMMSKRVSYGKAVMLLKKNGGNIQETLK